MALVSSRQIVTRSASPRRRAVTLIELLVVLAVVSALAALLLPALTSARQKARGLQCLGNARQMMLAWILYSDDASGYLPYNVGGAGTGRGVGARSRLNWADGILDWELSPDNTNSQGLVRGGIGPYLGRTAAAYQCPADRVLSALQREAGWTRRVRSYSMNAMMGNAGPASVSGMNVNNPGYRQFFRASHIPSPSRMFVLVDEHPDSLNDGYFLNRADARKWIDLPASYHGNAASFSFADGHAESHRWTVRSTRQPARPDGAMLPYYLEPEELSDWRWVTERMSVTEGATGEGGYRHPYNH